MRTFRQRSQVTTTSREFRKGFSLVEVMIVITIVAAAVTMISINVQGGLSEHRLRKAFDDLAVEIEAARTEAISRGEELLLRYDPEADTLRLESHPELDIIEYLSGDKEARRRALNNEEGALIRQFSIDSDVLDIESVYVNAVEHRQAVSIFFGPDGQGESHRVLLTVKETGGQSVALEYRGILGKIREIDPLAYRDEIESEVDGIETLIEDEEFFEGERPDKAPDPEGGPEGSDEDTHLVEGSE